MTSSSSHHPQSFCPCTLLLSPSVQGAVGARANKAHKTRVPKEPSKKRHPSPLQPFSTIRTGPFFFFFFLMSFLMLRVRVPKARAAFMISDPESSVQRWHLPVSLLLWRSLWNLADQ